MTKRPEATASLTAVRSGGSSRVAAMAHIVSRPASTPAMAEGASRLSILRSKGAPPSVKPMNSENMALLCRTTVRLSVPASAAIATAQAPPTNARKRTFLRVRRSRVTSARLAMNSS